MARLIDLNTQEVCYLKTYHTFGRKTEGTDTQILAGEVSNIHAIISWQGAGWYIKDLSRNGTWLDDRKLEKLVNVPIHQGQKICFASGKHSWVVDDISLPEDLVYRLDLPNENVPIDSYTLLPDDKNPECVISHNKQNATWYLMRINNAEHELNPNSIFHGDVINFANNQWRLFLAEDITTTRDLVYKLNSLQEAEFTFRVSMDEEHIDIHVKYSDERFVLENKTHNYLLLYLARKCIADFNRGISPEDSGWVNNTLLSKEIGVDSAHVNILIFRIRQHFSKILKTLSDPETIVQRRAGSTKINLPAKNISILKGGKVETTSDVGKEFS